MPAVFRLYPEYPGMIGSSPRVYNNFQGGVSITLRSDLGVRGLGLSRVCPVRVPKQKAPPTFFALAAAFAAGVA